MISNLFGNPHSASASSELSTKRTENVRLRVLQFFKADPEQFDVLFVANATAAIKLVMTAFQDCAVAGADASPNGFWYGYHRDSHTSLVGVRQLASAGSKCFASDQEVDEWLSGKLDLSSDRARAPSKEIPGLFAYPAQSNMTGHRSPLSWPGRLRKSTLAGHQNIYTLLDAAAYVSTAQLDLSDADMAPDFTALSFYKIFGFPDLGALIVRKAAGQILTKRRYFGGGTVDMVISMGSSWHAKKDQELHEQLEDGTLPFHNIIALGTAIGVHERLYGSMTRVSGHTCYLAKVMYEKLSSFRHANGSPVCEMYKDPTSQYGDSKSQAPTIAFNVRNSQGGWVGKSAFEALAIAHNIQLRTGGVCNPGGIASSLKLRPWELRRNYSDGVRCGNEHDMVGGKPTGIIRVSFGAMSSLKDIKTFMDFFEQCFVEKAKTHSLKIRPSDQWSQAESVFHLQRLTIAPIEGCLAWDIPSSAAWEFKEGALAWDREWCLIHLITREVLKPKDYPKMALLQPSLHLEDGILRIKNFSAASESTIRSEELTVNLWESPTGGSQQLTADASRPKADPYESVEIAQFFTDVLGVPCTLARYPDVRKWIASIKAAEHLRLERQGQSGAPHKYPIPLTMAINMGDDNSANIILPQLMTSCTHPTFADCQYLRLGSHYFQVLDNPQHLEKHKQQKTLRLLTNSNDHSLAAQNPTISVNDPVHMLSASDVTADARLQECIASSSLAATSIISPKLDIQPAGHKVDFLDADRGSGTSSELDDIPKQKFVAKTRWSRGTRRMKRFLSPIMFQNAQYA